MGTFKKIVQRLIPGVNAWAGHIRPSEFTSSTARDSLVKSRPNSLDSTYTIVDDTTQLDALFSRMRDQIMHNDALDSTSRQRVRPLRESGRIDPERPYFFIKPFNQSGLLFERSGAGWTVSKAEKIVKGDTFIRSATAWDLVTVYGPRDGMDGYPRVSSERLGLDRVAFPVYTQVLAETLADQWLEAGE